VTEYRPITPGHITAFDQRVCRKPFIKPTASSLQKYDHKVTRKKAQTAGKHRQAVK